MIRALLLAATLTWLGAPAAFACYARIAQVSEPTLSYDPFSGDALAGALVVRVENTGGHQCRMRLAFDAASGATRALRGPGVLPYALRTVGGAEVRNSATDAYGIDVTLPGRRSADVAVRLHPDRLQVVPPGRYTDPVEVRLFDLEHSRSLLAQRSATLAADVVPRAQVNFAGTRGRFGAGSVETLHLGELVTGHTERVFLQLRANTQVRVALSSENRGELRHAALNRGATVPYRLAIDGAIATLSGEHVFPSRPPATIDGHAHALDVTVTDAASRAAGAYHDLLTVTVTAY